MATKGPSRKPANSAKATSRSGAGAESDKASDMVESEVSANKIDAAKKPVEDAVVVLDDAEAVKAEVAAEAEKADLLPKPEPIPEPEPEATKPDVTEAESPAPATQDPPIVKASPGFVPLVFGGVVAAGLGFAVAHFVPEVWPKPETLALQSQVSDQAAAIAELRSGLQALPQTDDASAEIARLGAELETVRDSAATALQAAEAANAAAATGTAGEDLSPRVTALEERLTALETRPAGNATIDPAALSGLTADIAALRSELNAQKAAAATAAQQAETARVQTETEAQNTLLQAALTKVEAALNSGESYAESLALLSEAGLAIPPVLSENAEEGLPTMAALAEGFADPARAALEESLRGNMGSTWSQRFGSFLRSQTGARSLTPREGNDPDAVLSRANAAVAQGDLTTALTEITALPEAAQIALAGWVAQAELRLTAETATAELATALSER